MIDLFAPYLQWPVLPFSILLSMVMLYWVMVILGGIDLDMFDLDVDFDLDFDAEPSFTDWGLVGLKWFNLGDVPLMVWLGAFALSSFMITVLIDGGKQNLTDGELATIIARNIGLGVLAAKLLTQPLKGKLKFKEPNTVRDLLGQTCEVVSLQVNPTHGIAQYNTDDGAPLRLNVRTLDGTIAKGSIVQIIDYSTETGIYFVEPVEEVQA